jgi:chromosome partitioning protein
MGFLSRKPKSAPAVVVEEPHPIVEELRRMEEAVPELPEDRPLTGSANGSAVGEPLPADEGPGARPAGPVAEDGSSSSRDDAAGEEPSSTPPAGDAGTSGGGQAARVATEGKAAGPAAPVIEAEKAEEKSERFMPSDLLVPSRHEAKEEKAAEPEAPVKHAEVIAFANQKGGVAKTTTTLNLAVAFAESGHRVLCIDLDPQGNLTMSQGIDPDKVEKSLYDVLVHDMPIAEIVHHREIDIAVASIDLAGAEIAMSTKIGRERSLERALKEVSGDYDFICIDTPPSLGLLTINALTAATKVIVPVQCEYLSMRGLVQLQNTLRMIQENLNPDVKIEGILPTMLDSRTVHAKEAVEILEENFGELVFRSRIKKAIKFAEAPVKGASVLKYDSGSSAAGYYRELAKEVLGNESAS